jgi:hypothetical protein
MMKNDRPESVQKKKKKKKWRVQQRIPIADDDETIDPRRSPAGRMKYDTPSVANVTLSKTSC